MLKMDDDFYKLVALGWDGKSDVFEFIKEKLGIRLELDHRRKKLGIFYKRDGEEYVESLKKGNPINDETIISTVLRLFRTVDGVPEGPDPNFFIMNLEWT